VNWPARFGMANHGGSVAAFGLGWSLMDGPSGMAVVERGPVLHDARFDADSDDTSVRSRIATKISL